VPLVVAIAVVLWKIWRVRRLLWLLLRAKLGLANKQPTWISGDSSTGGTIECPACRHAMEVPAYQPEITLGKCGNCGLEILAHDPPNRQAR
jgi:hypothetical protein